jgi:hypothetical protein
MSAPFKSIARMAGIALALFMVATQQSAAQEHGHTVTPPAGASPYSGLQHRPIKALSRENIADLKAGRGMGLALAAELNGYPGPRHALELADALALSDEQRREVARLFDAMKIETAAIGERIIADETALDRLFAERLITEDELARLATRIGAAQGELRAAHLRYHLRMMDVLSPNQIERYAALRGYSDDGAHHGAH